MYVQPIPATGALWQISKDGGTMPRWCCQGKEVFYRANDGQLQAVPGRCRTRRHVCAVTGAARPQPSSDGKTFLVNVPSTTR